MAQQLTKLSPTHDLQCYFFEPSAIAALSATSENGFTVSGTWRQQFDWAVVEWNRDNVFEHPALRDLPDGDLSGLQLTYTETRTNCIPFESSLYPTVDWPYLRVWADDESGNEQVYFVKLMQYAQPLSQSVNATATLTLSGTAHPGDDIGLCMPTSYTDPATGDIYDEQHVYYTVGGTDDLTAAAAGLANAVNTFAQGYTAVAVANQPSLILTWHGLGNTENDGSNGNRITVYGYVTGDSTTWDTPVVTFTGGSYSQVYQVSLNFGALQGFTRDD